MILACAETGLMINEEEEDWKEERKLEDMISDEEDT